MILISCVSSKKDRRTEAKNLYDSTYFSAMKRYAESTNEEYRIVSAKHGLLSPDEVIEPYDEYGLSEELAEEVASELDGMNVDSVRIVAGKKYTNVLTPELEIRGIDVLELCRGMGIGRTIAELQTLAKENNTDTEQDTLC